MTTIFIVGIISVLMIVAPSAAFTFSSQSTFDKNFKKCFNAAPAPDYIKSGLPLKMWEALYKDYVGNLTQGKDIFPTSNLSMSINIAKQVDLCMRG